MKVLLSLFLILTPMLAESNTLHLDLGGWSNHYQKEYSDPDQSTRSRIKVVSNENGSITTIIEPKRKIRYNEKHDRIGLTYTINKLRISTGRYFNSYYRVSNYFGVGYDLVNFEPFKLGFSFGKASNYPSNSPGGTFITADLTIGKEPFSLVISTAAVVTFVSFKIKIF